MYSTKLHAPERKGHDLCDSKNSISPPGFGKNDHLEAENLVAELGNGLGRLEAKRGGGLLHSANHGWRTADEDLDVLCGAGATVLLFH